MITEILGYHFKDKELLKKALTHPSLCNDPNHLNNYERIEFLGDAVLGLIIVELLILQFPQEDEGKLARRKAKLVAGEILAQIAQEQNIGSKIYMSDSEAKHGGRENPHTLENVLEAIIGAIYLDDGKINEVKSIISKIWQPFIDQMPEAPIDPKSKLQELLQHHGKGLPTYQLIDSFGPKHMLTFKVSLKVSGFDEVIGQGKSKQQAEKHAATLLLEKIND